MLNAQNAQIKPNILGVTIQEQQAQRRQQAVLRDRSNRVRGARRWKNIQENNEKRQVQVENKEEIKETKEVEDKENIFLECDWGEENEDSELEDAEEVDSEEQINNLAEMYKNTKPSPKKEKSNQRSSFLLALSSDEDSQEQQLQPTQAKKHSNQTIAQTPNIEQRSSDPSDKIIEPSFSATTANQFLFTLDDDCSSNHSAEEEQSEKQKQKCPYRNSLVLPLSSLIVQHKEQYFFHSIPQAKVFQCVMKRQKNQLATRYHLYDSVTLRNFMTVVKGDDYLIVSKYDSASLKHVPNLKKKDKIVGIVSSNFFGTEFTCSLENVPYKGRNQEISSHSKKQRVMTIQYQTNLFGLRGPRKMTCYAGQTTFSSSLSEVYEKEKNSKHKTVGKFKNKIPKWCDQTGSYVLNFYGRATVSSIKNFIIVGQDEDEQALPRVLFGKFGKQLFNLDIRYPFSILQGLALAISSFDKKLACE